MTNDAGSKLLAGGLSRRMLLKTGAAAAGAIAAPAIVSRRVLASSGEVNVLFWSDDWRQRSEWYTWSPQL